MRLGITSASGWTLRMASLAALNSCPPPSQFCGGARGESGESRVPSASSSSSGAPGTRALERDTATGATRAGVRIHDHEMNAREDARRDAREDAPGARHLSYLVRGALGGQARHSRGSRSRRRRRATRPQLARARRARGWRAPRSARRGGRATPARRRTTGGRAMTRPSRSAERGRPPPRKWKTIARFAAKKRKKKRVTNSYAQTVTGRGAVDQGGRG